MITTDKKPAIKHPRKMAREPKTDAAPQAAPKRETKSEQVLALLTREEGATIDQLVTATGWLPHTTRAALTCLKKKGHAVTSDKVEGQGRIYRVVAP